MSLFVVKTLGCKANLFDSQQIEEKLLTHGFSAHANQPAEEVAVCVVNSCTVTDEADKQSVKLASRLSREFPNAKIIFTGCSAEVNPEKLKSAKGIDYVIGNRDKPKFFSLLDEVLDAGKPAGTLVLGETFGYGEMTSRHPIDREWPLPSFSEGDLAPHELGESHRTRVFLKIQEGCDSFCTYCVIPYGRGPSRSLRPREILDHIRKLVSIGTKEIVLTGTNIGDYGFDWLSEIEKTELVSRPLDDLVEMILGETELSRLRLSSLDPVEISERLIALMEKNQRLCAHFHVSLQSPHSRILKLMKRKYRFEEVKTCLDRISKLRVDGVAPFVGMDVIAGFPGESLDEFKWGVEALSQLYWSRLHVFPYSEREGTPATRLPDSVEMSERKRRAKVLAELSLSRIEKQYQDRLLHFRTSGLKSVLTESAVKGPDGTRDWVSGYSPTYDRVLVAKKSLPLNGFSNRLIDVLPTSIVLDKTSGEAFYLGELIS